MLLGWITSKVIKMNVALTAAGSLISDMFYKRCFVRFSYSGLCVSSRAVSYTFFESAKKAFIAFGIGITTHFILDLLLFPSAGEIRLFFPYS